MENKSKFFKRITPVAISQILTGCLSLTGSFLVTLTGDRKSLLIFLMSIIGACYLTIGIKKVFLKRLPQNKSEKCSP